MKSTALEATVSQFTATIVTIMSENGDRTWERPFWEQPVWRWEAMFHAGVRAHFVASRMAAPLMIQQRSGRIVTISFWAAQKHIGNLIYGVAKAATDTFAFDSAEAGMADHPCF